VGFQAETLLDYLLSEECRKLRLSGWEQVTMYGERRGMLHPLDRDLSSQASHALDTLGRATWASLPNLASIEGLSRMNARLTMLETVMLGGFAVISESLTVLRQSRGLGDLLRCMHTCYSLSLPYPERVLAPALENLVKNMQGDPAQMAACVDFIQRRCPDFFEFLPDLQEELDRAWTAAARLSHEAFDDFHNLGVLSERQDLHVDPSLLWPRVVDDVHEGVYEAHPDWVAKEDLDVDAHGRPRVLLVDLSTIAFFRCSAGAPNGSSDVLSLGGDYDMETITRSGGSTMIHTRERIAHDLFWVLLARGEHMSDPWVAERVSDMAKRYRRLRDAETAFTAKVTNAATYFTVTPPSHSQPPATSLDHLFSILRPLRTLFNQLRVKQEVQMPALNSTAVSNSASLPSSPLEDALLNDIERIMST